ncbi:MAG: hypothetical protein ACT4PO_01015 [Actinomycetota bacterium]
MEPSLGDVERATKALRARPESWRLVPAHSSLATRRWIVALQEDRTAFVKIAAHDDSASWLRDEHMMYARLKADFMPRLLGWHDDGDSRGTRSSTSTSEATASASGTGGPR